MSPLNSPLRIPFVGIYVLITMLTPCNEAKPQTGQERKQAENNRRAENIDQFFLGAMKMCQNTDYREFFGDHRELTYSPRNGNCCTGLMPPPYINPYEFYIEMFDDQPQIFVNNANPFELKKLRESYQGEISNLREKVQSIDTDNLVHRMQGFFVEYNLNSQELKLNCSSALSFSGIKQRGQLQGVDLINMPSELTVSIDADSAEQLFEYYTKNHPTGKLIPFTPLNIRLTYGLKFPEKNTQYSKFEGVVKNIDIYPADNWTDKVATIIF